MATCCGAIFTLRPVNRKADCIPDRLANDTDILHDVNRRRCGKKVRRYFKVLFANKTDYYLKHPIRSEIDRTEVFGLCVYCAAKSPDIFQKKYIVPKTVQDYVQLLRSMNRSTYIDTTPFYGRVGVILSIEECDPLYEKSLARQKQLESVKLQLKSALTQMENTMHISDPGIWQHVFSEAMNELIVEGIMKA